MKFRIVHERKYDDFECCFCYSMLLEYFKLPQTSKGCLIHALQGLATTEFSCEKMGVCLERDSMKNMTEKINELRFHLRYLASY